jgi:hypothetical protein
MSTCEDESAVAGGELGLEPEDDTDLRASCILRSFCTARMTVLLDQLNPHG